MKFTGHERDLASAAAPGDDLDYMHARHESPVTGRFLSVDPGLNVEKTIKQPQKWNRYAYVLSNPLKYTDPNGQEESLIGGFVVNNSSQDIFIAFDTGNLRSNGKNLDVVIPIHPGEDSDKFTFDADAVIVGPGQNISGAEDGSFKLSAGSVEVKDGKKKGQLVLVSNITYRGMKGRTKISDRSGYLSKTETPEQWKINQTPEQMEGQRREASATLAQRLWKALKNFFLG
jgi:RHS repeat-associated protein